MSAPQMFALVSKQGTACAETALCSGCYEIPRARFAVEATADVGHADAPQPGSWTDCTGNDALVCRCCTGGAA